VKSFFTLIHPKTNANQWLKKARSFSSLSVVWGQSPINYQAKVCYR